MARRATAMLQPQARLMIHALAGRPRLLHVENNINIISPIRADHPCYAYLKKKYLHILAF